MLSGCSLRAWAPCTQYRLGGLRGAPVAADGAAAASPLLFALLAPLSWPHATASFLLAVLHLLRAAAPRASLPLLHQLLTTAGPSGDVWRDLLPPLGPSEKEIAPRRESGDRRASVADDDDEAVWRRRLQAEVVGRARREMAASSAGWLREQRAAEGRVAAATLKRQRHTERYGLLHAATRGGGAGDSGSGGGGVLARGSLPGAPKGVEFESSLLHAQEKRTEEGRVAGGSCSPLSNTSDRCASPRCSSARMPPRAPTAADRSGGSGDRGKGRSTRCGLGRWRVGA